MKIDFAALILNLNGEPMKLEGMTKDLTLGEACVLAVLMPEGTENLTGLQKAQRFQIAMKVQSGGAGVSAEDITVLKEAVGSIFPPLVVGRCYELLDPKA